jgi:hypothetical protein
MVWNHLYCLKYWMLTVAWRMRVTWSLLHSYCANSPYTQSVRSSAQGQKVVWTALDRTNTALRLEFLCYTLSSLFGPLHKAKACSSVTVYMLAITFVADKQKTLRRQQWETIRGTYVTIGIWIWNVSLDQCFSTFVRPRPGPNKFIRKYISIFFKFIH